MYGATVVALSFPSPKLALANEVSFLDRILSSRTAQKMMKRAAEIEKDKMQAMAQKNSE